MSLCDLLVHSPSTVASSTHCCATPPDKGRLSTTLGPMTSSDLQKDRAALEKLFLICEEAIRAKWRVLEPLSELQQARSATDIKKALILGMEPTLCFFFFAPRC